MIKKVTAFSIILMANIVLLAHAVIPHHHHHSIVCVEQRHCHENEIDHNHDVDEQDHQHDNANSTTCVLQQAVIVPASQGKILKNYDFHKDNTHHEFLLLPNYHSNELLSVSVLLPIGIDFSPLSTSFIASSHGFRAPPKV